MSRNAIELYDPELIHKQTQLQMREKMKASGHKPQRVDPNAPIFKMFADLAAKQDSKFRQREEEKRKRDPSYRPDAIELNDTHVRPFDEKVDYYARLDVDQFSSALEIKKAYMKLSLLFHPDKQVGKSDAQKKAANDRFKELTEAYEVLSDMATRRQYDRARDNNSVSKEHFGYDINTADPNPSPPTCVDVEVPLQTLYRGSIHKVAFERKVYNMYRRTHDVSTSNYSLKINRGMLDGSTFWFKGEGHQLQGKGPSDLVFVLQQIPHPQFERVGDDLWYYISTPLRAEALHFCALVPTITGRLVLARGNTLPILLGFDRTGLGEAIVEGHGMPLRDDVVLAAARAGRSAYAYSRDEAPQKTRGDMIVKFRVELPSKPRRLCVCDGGIKTPPITLITSAGGPLEARQLPHAALRTVLLHSWLPALLEFAFHKRSSLLEHARNNSSANISIPGFDSPDDPPTPAQLASAVSAHRSRASFAAPSTSGTSTHLHAIFLRVGANVVIPPSGGAKQVMNLLSLALPCLEWREVHMTSGLEQPLLDEEEIAIASAAFIVLEVSPSSTLNGSAIGNPEIERGAVGSLAPGDKNAFEAGDFYVLWRPGVRVRAAPSTNAAVVGLVRFGHCLHGRNVQDGWIELASGTGYVQSDGGSLGPLLSRTRPRDNNRGEGLTRSHGSMAHGATEASLTTQELEARAALQEFDERSDEDEEGEEREEVKYSLESAYVNAGCKDAIELLAHPSASAIYRCHCSGGLLIALDLACTVLGARAKPAIPAWKKKKKDYVPLEEGTPPLQSWPHLLPHLVGLPIALDRQCDFSYSRRRIEWRRLRGAALRLGPGNGKHGYCAVGLPAGCVVSLLPGKAYAMRVALGSSQPEKLSFKELEEAEQKRMARKKQVKVDARRTEKLAEILQVNGKPMTGPLACRGYMDGDGCRRGMCQLCCGCPGFCAVDLSEAGQAAQSTLLSMHCVHCGCLFNEHELMIDNERKSLGF